MSVINLNSDNFKEEVLDSDIPVVVDFWASWCGPCKMFAPIIDQVAEAQEGKVKFAKLNIDEYPQYAEEYKVMSIPTIVLFEGGEAKKTSVGVLSKQSVEDFSV